MNVPRRLFRLFVVWLRRLKHGPHDSNMGWFDLNAPGRQSFGDSRGERIGMIGKIVPDCLRLADGGIVFWHGLPPQAGFGIGAELTSNVRRPQEMVHL
jgi:hypothetical protein